MHFELTEVTKPYLV